MQRKLLGYTAVTAGALSAVDGAAILLGVANPSRWDAALRILTDTAITSSVLWGLAHVVAAMRRVSANQRVVAVEIKNLRQTLENISRCEQHRASYLRGQVDVLTQNNGRRPDSVPVV
jgi:hypothetical protein